MSAPASTDQPREAPFTAPPVENEWSLLRAMVSEPPVKWKDCASTLREGTRWKVLFELADRHGVQPLLYRTLSQAEGLVPASEMHLLTQLYQTNLYRGLFLCRELIHILEHLAEAGIEVLPYKGVVLAEVMYGDIVLRQAGDIDLLIHPRDFPRLKNSLRELGYLPHSALTAAEERASLKSGSECVFDGAAGRNLLELQWAIQPRFYAVDFDHESVFGRAVSARVSGHMVKTPSAEDLFIILSLHAAKHVWSRLIWLCDLARIMQMPELDWSWIAAQARQLGIVRILRTGMLLAERLLSAEIPAAAEANIPADSEASPLAREIDVYLTSGGVFNVESFAYFRLMLRLREERRDRIRFLTRLIFTPGPGEWHVVRLPAPLFPLYRLVRFGRLAGKLCMWRPSGKSTESRFS